MLQRWKKNPQRFSVLAHHQVYELFLFNPRSISGSPLPFVRVDGLEFKGNGLVNSSAVIRQMEI
jgi:hypothetical protein